MYAIVETGGKQYKASVGDVLEVERLDIEPGQPVEFERVLLIRGDEDTVVGTPLVDGAVVKGEALSEGKDRKVIVFKMKRRKGYRRKAGHRQQHSRVRITAIESSLQSESASKPKPLVKLVADVDKPAVASEDTQDGKEG